MCEYCNKKINNKSIKCIDAPTDKSKLTLIKDGYFGYTILAEIDNLADDSSNKVELLGDIIFEKNEIQIIFDFTKKKIVIHCKNVLEPELIQAINEKVKELGRNE